MIRLRQSKFKENYRFRKNLKNFHALVVKNNKNIIFRNQLSSEDLLKMFFSIQLIKDKYLQIILVKAKLLIMS